ncbi:hypothetical protein B0H14DRAFT_3483654 [Mycena olivaceomarginata]|nr:hypothetical protein B0H14DRAFT_3483654 [Mycena olivaceomarginata]
MRYIGYQVLVLRFYHLLKVTYRHAEFPERRIHQGGTRVSSASTLCASLPWATPLALDVATADPTALEVAVAAHDLVFSLVPYMHHAALRVLTADDFTIPTPHVRVWRHHVVDHVVPERRVSSRVQGQPAHSALPARNQRRAASRAHNQTSCQTPDCADNPLGYKFCWSPRGGLLAFLNSASFLANGAVTHVAGADLMASAQLCAITSFAPALEAFPNRDSVPFRAFYRIPEAHTTRWLAADVKEWLVDGLEWREATQRAVGASASDEDALVARIKEVCAFPFDSESARIVSGMRWMGPFSPEKLVTSWRARSRAPSRAHLYIAAHENQMSVSLDRAAHLPVPGDVVDLDHALEQREDSDASRSFLELLPQNMIPRFLPSPLMGYYTH